MVVEHSKRQNYLNDAEDFKLNSFEESEEMSMCLYMGKCVNK